jgi:hypothetical protein
MTTRTQTQVRTFTPAPAPPPTPQKQQRTVPAWAFYTVVAIAIVFGILAGLFWYFLQQLRKDMLDPAKSQCPTIQPITCSRINADGSLQRACKSSCETAADCPSYAPNCNNNICKIACNLPSDCPAYAPNCTNNFCEPPPEPI